VTPEEFQTAYPKVQAWIQKTLASYEKDAHPIASIVNPAVAAGRMRSGGRQTRFDNPETGAGTLTQRHGWSYKTEAFKLPFALPRYKGSEHRLLTLLPFLLPDAAGI